MDALADAAMLEAMAISDNDERPWIVQGACGSFCDCHMEFRRAWMKPAGIRYWE